MKGLKTRCFTWKRWTDHEIDLVIRLRLEGRSIRDIATATGRNESSVGELLRKPSTEDRILTAQGL